LALILIIDSAFEQCIVALSNNEEVIAHEESIVQKDHASFLQPAIKKVCDTASLNLSAIDAIAVVNGPGSYTGLRVGLASAKGIAYVLNKPLLLLNALDILAFTLQKNSSLDKGVLFCPMIDARRMEVFTALYNSELKLLKEYASVVLDKSFLYKEKSESQVIVGGNGSLKLKMLQGFEHIIFGSLTYMINQVAQCAFQKYKSGNFANLAYSEPFYIKPAYIK
jgi:tRNA threonylcarbamoyladenosine biosynthesis protein TsaB